MSLSRVSPWAALLLLGSACGAEQPPPPRPPRPLCFLRLRSGDGAHAKKAAPSTLGGAVVRNVRPEQWRSLLVEGGRDCSGQSIGWQEPRVHCAEPAAESEPVGPTTFTEDDVIVSRVTPDKRLVWVITDRFANGEAMGPVALAEYTDDGVGIRAIGTLRGLPGRARLRLQRSGAARMLVAEGEQCADPNDPSSCQRYARIMPMRHGRFLSSAIVRDDGTCIGPAWFAMTRDQTITLDSGWNRRFQMTTAMTFDGGGVTLHEQVVVNDTDPRHPAMPPRPFRTASSDRSVLVHRGELVGDQTSLWYRVMLLHASVQPRLRDAGSDVGP